MAAGKRASCSSRACVCACVSVCLRTHMHAHTHENRSLLKSVEKQKDNQVEGSRHTLASCVDTLAGKEKRNLTRKVKQAHSGSRAMESGSPTPLGLWDREFQESQSDVRLARKER